MVVDFTPVVKQVIIFMLLPLFFIIFAKILKSAWFKGVAGEFMVNLSAKIFLNKKKYHLIKNVTLPTENGSTQIDHIIVSKYGVFVIETKNMKGWIFGNKNQKTWTQQIYKYSRKFQNPLHQNYKHTKTLESLLELNEQQIHSIVVFVGDSKFKTDMPENVTSGGGYIRFIKSKTRIVLTKSEINRIINKIESGRLIRSFKTNREHIKHVKNIIAEKENSVKACPKCGESMILREAKKGKNIGKKFWGCSNFPKCRCIVNIT
jgi:predicted RNA-binding Zn-ribbon protein involved in translation (DUF1610 family)